MREFDQILLEIKNTMREFDQILLEIKNTWNRVTVPGTTSSDVIERWLDENCTGRYYFDTMFLNPQENVVSSDWAMVFTDEIRTLPELYLENVEDMVFYNLHWNKYDN